MVKAARLGNAVVATQAAPVPVDTTSGNLGLQQ